MANLRSRYLSEGDRGTLARTINAARGELDTPEAQQYIGQMRDRAQDLQTKRQRQGPKQPRNMDDLTNLVLANKRDIKLIRDAQSKQGAQKWIDDRKYGDFLEVQDDDVDGDGVPDIMVVDRQSRKPHIVKGYTTRDSRAPYRALYYTQYPTRESRKDHNMHEFLDDYLGVEYDASHLNRNYANTQNVELVKHFGDIGYAKYRGSNKVTLANAFKWRIMKPVMKSIKQAIAEIRKDPAGAGGNAILNLQPATAIKIEATIRNNLFVIPVLQKLYGDDVIDLQPKELERLSKIAQVREVSRGLFAQFLAHINTEIDNIVIYVINALMQGNSDGSPALVFEGSVNAAYIHQLAMMYLEEHLDAGLHYRSA